VGKKPLGQEPMGDIQKISRKDAAKIRNLPADKADATYCYTRWVEI